MFALRAASTLYSAENQLATLDRVILNLKEMISKAKAGIFVHLGACILS